MSIRYFATRSPKIAIYCQNGQPIRWPAYPDESMLSFDSEDRKEVIACLERCLKQGTGGDIREVGKDEFEAWQKKTSRMPAGLPQNREEITGGPAVPTILQKPASPSRKPAAVAAVEAVVPKLDPNPAAPAVSPTPPAIPTVRKGP